MWPKDVSTPEIKVECAISRLHLNYVNKDTVFPDKIFVMCVAIFEKEPVKKFYL